MNPETRQKVLDAIGAALPTHFKISEQDIYSPKTIYNLCSQGRGPELVAIGGQKYLEKDSFLSWLACTPGLKRGRKRQAVCQKAV